MSHETNRLFGSLWAVIAVPADLAFLLVATVSLAATFAVPVAPAIRTVAALPLLLFFPGYAFVSALFPGEAPESPTAALTEGGLDVVERFALAFGTSIVIVPVVGLVLATGPWGITLWTVIGAHSAVIAVLVGVAVVRRAWRPKEQRFVLPYRHWLASARENVVAVPRRNAVVNIAVALAVVGAVAAVGVGIASPLPRDGYDSMSLLTESPDGSLVAADYPSEVTVGESVPVVLQVENHHAEATQYTVVVQLQEVADDGTVMRRAELDRLDPTVAAGESWQQRNSFEPAFAGEDLRLMYLLYTDDVPQTPTRANADQEVHLWITVKTGT